MPPLVVGLTGSIGSGKSAVLRILSEMGFPCSDADRLAREAVEPGSQGLQEVVEAFGPKVLAKDGSLDRRQVGEIVFADPEARRTLERIVHPKVLDAQRRFVQRNAGAPLVALDIPLLFESGFDAACDRIATVAVDETTRLERLAKREDQLSPDEVQRRLRAQMPQSEKIARSDAAIDNSGSLEETRRQVEAIVGGWLAERSGKTGAPAADPTN